MGTKIYNSYLTKELREGAKIQTSVDMTPSEIAEKVVPVMEVNPKLLRTISLVKSSSFNNNTTGTIFTTDANNDTFIVAAQLAYIKDVTSTATRIGLNAFVDGAGTTAVTLARDVSLSLTVHANTVFVSYPIPVKLQRNTAVTITSDSATGNVTVGGVLFGYTVDNVNA